MLALSRFERLRGHLYEPAIPVAWGSGMGLVFGSRSRPLDQEARECELWI